MKKLQKVGKLVITPPQDYDDDYAISYANWHGGFIVTNDMFRDAIEKLESLDAVSKLKKKLISYTFVKGKFFPNPNAHFFK